MASANASEKMFYNAVWKASACNHREIKKLKDAGETWEQIFRKFSRSGKTADPDAEQEKLEENGVKLIMADEPDFPELLREIYWPPYGIYTKGGTGVFSQKAVAIVGTRKATEDGSELARQFGSDLARAGVSVISGLAFGIDAAAHKGCLSAGGFTAAVLACGLDKIYPSSNERLADEILSAGGTLISEYPIGTPPLPHRFIERNRIVSGLSLGIVVVEAPERSGSLATARFASEQNREVFVVPGPAGHRNFFGSHKLIRSGARLVSGAADMLADLDISVPASQLDTGEINEEKIIFEIVKNSREPLGIDKIAEIAELESRVASQALTLLLLKNVVKENGEGYSII